MADNAESGEETQHKTMRNSNHPAPGAKMPEGGSEFAKESIQCDRCDSLATRNWEGDRQFLNLCESCHDDLARWLNR